MADETLKILELIAGGVITAEEGATLLDALDSSPQAELPALAPAPAPPPLPPPKPAWARFWLYPVVAGLLLASLGIGYSALAVNGSIGWGWLFLSLPALALGSIIFLAGWFTRRSNWLHLRVKDGTDNINFSLPLPPALIGWSLKLARPFVPQLADFSADELLEALAETSPEGVFHVEVEEAGGEHVQIYYG